MSDIITVTINGEEQRLPAAISLTGLLEKLEIEGRVAIDRNGEIVPRSQHADTQLEAGDRLEIVHAIGGG